MRKTLFVLLTILAIVFAMDVYYLNKLVNGATNPEFKMEEIVKEFVLEINLTDNEILKAYGLPSKIVFYKKCKKITLSHSVCTTHMIYMYDIPNKITKNRFYFSEDNQGVWRLFLWEFNKYRPDRGRIKGK